jgi:hypothetical protein
VNLAGREVLEVRQTELPGEGIDLGMLEQLVARHVDIGDGRVLLERALAGHLLGEIVARVEELQEAANGVDVLVGEFNLASLWRTGSAGCDAH